MSTAIMVNNLPEVSASVILTGLTNTSSRKVFQDIFSYSGVKKSIMGRSSVGKLDEIIDHEN